MKSDLPRIYTPGSTFSMAEDPDPGGDNAHQTSVSGSGANSSDSPGTNGFVNDGLLCSIVKAISTCDNDVELIAAIGRQISEAEVKISHSKLFNYFDEVYDETRKVKIKDIKRQSKNLTL